MAKIYTNFTNFSDTDLLVKGETIIASMRGNAYFTGPLPPIADVKAALDAFNIALQNVSASNKDAMIIKNKARATVETFLSNLGLYIQFESMGDERALQSSGYELLARRSSMPVLIR